MLRSGYTVGIAGLGLIGGSIGLALKTRSSWRLVGYDTVPAAARAAVSLGACDAVAETLPDLARVSDLLIVAVPASRIPEVVLEAARHMRPQSVITDVGSVKAPVLNQVLPYLPLEIEFVGGHPMAGSHLSGIQAASCNLFEQTTWVLCPGKASPRSLKLVETAVRCTGARPVIADPLEHDAAVAFSSHLPYLVAVALSMAVRTGATRLPLVNDLRASGFRDTTRLARQAPEAPLDYCLLNHGALAEALEVFETCLQSLRAWLSNADHAGLMSVAAVAADYARGAVQCAGADSDPSR